MLWGELRTMFFAALGEKATEVSAFEFGQYIDKAQVFLASVLPEATIPSLIDMVYLDRGDWPGAMQRFPLPERYLSAVGVRVSLTRDVSDASVFESCMLTDPVTFRSMQEWGGDRVAAVFDRRLHVHPMPLAEDLGFEPSVEFIYRRRPEPYMRGHGKVDGVVGNLVQDPENRRHFSIVPITGSFATWSDYGADPEEFQGGECIIGPQLAQLYKGTFYKCRIDSTWDGATNPEFVVSSDSDVPIAGMTLLWCHMNKAWMPNEQNVSESADNDSPEIDGAWHWLMVEHAIASAELRLGLTNQHQLRMSRLMQELQGAGVILNLESEQEKKNG
jgi:hypothetical protein